MNTRCKFQCQTATTRADKSKDFSFTAISSGNDEEDKKFHKWTPSGSLTFNCLNPNVDFTPGKAYYLDVSEASVPE